MRCLRVHLVLILLASASIACATGPGEVTASWETTDTPIHIRILRHAEKNGGLVGGAYYVFQVADPDLKSWREIMTFGTMTPYRFQQSKCTSRTLLSRTSIW